MVMAVERDGAGQLEVVLQRAFSELPAARLCVQLFGDELQICGQADTWHDKQRAQEIARRLCPALRIHNAVQVNGRWCSEVFSGERAVSGQQR